MATSEATLSELISARSDLSVGSKAVDRMLRAVRRHLALDVAFVAQFRAEDRIFRHVDAQSQSPIRAGDIASLKQGYCQRVVDGLLPELIPDTRLVAAAMELPETRAIPIGAHLSVPIRLADGSIYGTFCCFSFQPNSSLSGRDLQMMRVFAELLADQIDRDLLQAKVQEQRIERVRSALSADLLSSVYQPIYDIETGQVAGFECLSRFGGEPRRPPNEWFAEADEIGLGMELESAAIRTGLRGLATLPPPIYLSLNCSPKTVKSGALSALLQGVDLRRIVVELTEHVQIRDYTALLSQLAILRAHGLRVAIDDAGAGYASMRHIIHVRPDFIKLDISLTKHIDTDPMRRALAAALIAFARETKAEIVAEGVETAPELQALKRLGVTTAQGYFLSRPVPAAEAGALVAKTLPLQDLNADHTVGQVPDATALPSKSARG